MSQPADPEKKAFVPIRNTVIGNRVDQAKVHLAKELRKEMTPAERLLWARLRGNRLGGFHFRRQQVIQGFIADFYCHASALVIELDGLIHENQQDYDAERDRVLTAAGFRILRFSNEQVKTDLSGVLKGILEACREKT